MAESAQNYDNEEDSQPEPQPYLSAIPGGGQTSEPRRGHPQSLPGNTGGKSSSPEALAAGEQQRAAPAPDAAGQAEKAKLQQKAPSLYDQDKEPADGKGKGGLERFRKKRPFTLKQKLMGGGIVGAVGGSIAFFLIFMPILRLESYMARINQRAFAVTAHAVEARAGHLLERYMISHTLDLERCNNVITNACRAPIKGGLAGGLFSAWRDVGIEQTLLDRYGWEIKSLNNPDRSAGANRFEIIDRRNGNRLVTLTNGHLQQGSFTGGNRELGRDMRKFLKEETKWNEVMHRRSVRKYLERKHGMKLWCFFACKTRDNVEIKKADAKTRYKYRFVERFVFPFSGKYGFIMNCIISGNAKCTPEDLRKQGIDRQKLSDEDVKNVVAHFEANPNSRLSQYVIENLLHKVMSQQAARSAVGAIPVAGQIYFGLVVIDMFDRMDAYIENNGLSKLDADLKARQYLEFYAGMRSVNDEMKSHAISLDEAGAVMTDFDGAEDSLVSQAYTQPLSTAATIVGKVHAQAAQEAPKKPYVCANGQPIPKGEYVCNEKKLNRSFAVEDWRNNRLVDGLADTLNLYRGAPSAVIRPILNTVDKIATGVLSPILSAGLAVVRQVPGAGAIVSFAEKKGQDLMGAFLGGVFPLPVQLESPGREKYDALEAGADIAAMEFAKGGYNEANEPYGQGAPAISDSQAAALYEDYFQQQAYEYRSSGLLTRLTDMQYPNSFANRAVLSMPTRVSAFPRTIASSFSGLLHGAVGSLWGNAPAYAQQPQLAINAFGVPRHGYPRNDTAFTRNPEELTKEYCEEARKAWEASKKDDEVSGIDTYSVANPCLLELSAIEAAGSLFAQ